MTDRDRLHLFITTALPHGGTIPPFDPERGDTWEAQDSGVALNNRDGELYLFVPVSTLLYGGDLGLLRAACGEHLAWNTGVTKQGKGGGLVFEGGPLHQWVAQQSVLLPDHERLVFVCGHLRQD